MARFRPCLLVSFEQIKDEADEQQGGEPVRLAVRLSPMALFVFFPAAAGTGVVAADLVVASMNSLRCDRLFSAIEDERWLGA